MTSEARVADPVRTSPRAVGPLYGKYRGRVTTNLDPDGLGRVLASVPQIPGLLLGWAMPSVPFAGIGVGFYAIPPIGANVWIEFEGGNPTRPIWSGCFWGNREEVPAPALDPDVKIWKTQYNSLTLDDTPEIGGATLASKPVPANPINIEEDVPAVDVPSTLRFSTTGILLTCPESSMEMTPLATEITVPEASISLVAELIEITVPESTMSFTPEAITAGVPPTTATLSATSIVIDAPLVQITAEVNIDGAVTIEGDVNISGAQQVEGNVTVGGAQEIAGDLEVAGAQENQGEVNVLGGFQVEGDANFLGAQQTEGDVAVLGAIEGIILPPKFPI